ncbi:MAG: class I SAM-dependent methyltransferase [Chitinophagaceae bacterium]
MEVPKNWFVDWFNSPYYQVLYFNRDEREVSSFMGKLLKYLHLRPGVSILDMACGRGRYARFLSEREYFVTGIDLSEKCILTAKNFENDHLHFYQHDMRLPFRINYYDLVLNFFTSFGYFSTWRENENALRTMMEGLKPGGTLVLDYLNSHFVSQHLVPDEVKVIEGIEFYLHREHQTNKFLKRIAIHDISKLNREVFLESVFAFTLDDFQKMFTHQGLTLVETFGDYHFNAFDKKVSPRLILIATKNG